MDKGANGLFSKQVDDYIAWKKHVLKQLQAYRNWLDEYQLSTEEVDQKLLIAQGVLQTDQITLAFVGEFSRGKTELINALFFSQHGQRLLPSRPGRTTMCPAELFFDLKERESWIRLLPIETRKDHLRISDLKDDPEAWHCFDLDLSSPEQMAETLAHVCDAKAVSPAYAKELGFDLDQLEHDLGDPDLVTIPVWRHALISFNHPLLRQGLRIIDTPGLNALGSEPELTLRLLEESQAVLFLMGADTGVTATDLRIWEDHIKHLSGKLHDRMFVVLNKVDTLWDDPDGDDVASGHLNQVIQQSAKILEVPSEGIVPLSAKAGLRARLYADDELFHKSGLDALEQALSESIIQGKEQTLKKQVIDDALEIMRQNQKALIDEQKYIQVDLRSLESAQGKGEVRLFRLNERVKKEQQYYQKRLMVLQPIENRLKTQLPNWLKPFNQESIYKWELILQLDAKKRKKKDFKRSIHDYFTEIRRDFSQLKDNSAQALSLIRYLYQEYAKDHEKFSIKYDGFDFNYFQNQLEVLEMKANAYTRSAIKFWRDQLLSSNQFSAALHAQITTLTENERKAIEQWCEQAMTPILYHAKQRKQLKRLLESPNEIPDHVDKLRIDSEKITNKLDALNQIIEQVQYADESVAVPILKT